MNRPPSLREKLKLEGRPGAAFLAGSIALSAAAVYYDWHLFVTLALAGVFIVALELVI